jgi:hypothetical protein
LVSGCVVSTPAVGTSSSLAAVATVTKTDAWAVGYFNDGAGNPHDLIEHFDGVRWSAVPIPSMWGTGLQDVTAISASNVWAVGGGRTLHWNGQAWTVAALEPTGAFLAKVAGGHDGSLVAVGETHAGFTVLVWSSTGWKPLALQPAPPASHRTCDDKLILSDITMTVKTDVWVSGFMQHASNIAEDCTYTAHWNGAGWSTIPTPSPGTGSSLTAISARIPTNVWAVGDAPELDPASGRIFDNPLALHWNGASWQQVRTVANGFLTDVDATGNAIWAVGTFDFGKLCVCSDGHQTAMLIQRWDGTAFIDQAVQYDIHGPATPYSQTFVSGVSVRDGLAISVGQYVVKTSPLISLGGLTDVRADSFPPGATFP